MNLKTNLIIVCLSLLTACSTNPRKEIFDNAGPEMDELFHKNKRMKSLKDNSYGRSSGRNEPYTRSQDKELSDLFPEAYNKRLSVYVFPHISNGHPIPGYTTTTYLYSGSQNYLLPGEVDQRRP